MKKTKILLVGSLLLGTIIFSQGLGEAKKVSAEDLYESVAKCDFSTKKGKSQAYNNSWTYDTNWNVFGGANNNGAWSYIKLGGQQKTLATANPVYINNKNAINKKVDKIEITTTSANLSVGSVNSWGVYVYSDSSLSNQIDYVKGENFTAKKAETISLVPSKNITWDAGLYYKITFDLKNTTKTNGIICINNIDFLAKKEVSSTSYYVSFDKDNGEDNEIKEVPNDGNSLVEEPAIPSKDGYEFDGWYYGDNRWDFNNPVTSNMTLVAHWNEKVTSIADVIAKASGTFVIEGEVVGKQNSSTCSVQDSTGAILIYDTIECSKLKTGNSVRIKGTYAEYNGNKELTSITIISCDSTDTKVDTLPITNEKEINKNNSYKYVSLNNLKINGSVTTSKNNKTVKVLNKDFVLWYTDTSTVKGEEYLTNGAYVNVEGYIQMYNNTIQILVTNITKANTYTITYNSLGGTSVASQTVGEGEKFTKPGNPTKTSTEYEEYDFGGWYLDENCSDGKEFNFDNDVTGNIIVYAKWNVIKKSVSTKFTSVKTQANLGFDYTETITKEEDALASTFVPNKVEAPFTTNGYTYSNGLGVLSSTTSYIEFEVENELIDTTEINFSGKTNSNGKIKFVSYDKNRQVIETSTEYTLTTEYQYIICELTKYENVKYIRLEVSELSENDTVSIAAYQVDTYFVKTTTSYTDFRNVMMQFRYEFDASKFEDVSSIGIALTKDTEFNFEQQGLETLPEKIKLYETKKDNGTDYNTSLTIGVKNIPTNAYDTSLVAVAYVKTTEGKYYFAEKSTYSVNEMVLKYLDTLDKTTEMYKILDAFAGTL